jgi:hypothetical protein
MLCAARLCPPYGRSVRGEPVNGRNGIRMLLALTGTTGFIGQYLLRQLPQRGYRVRALLLVADASALMQLGLTPPATTPAGLAALMRASVANG